MNWIHVAKHLFTTNHVANGNPNSRIEQTSVLAVILASKLTLAC